MTKKVNASDVALTEFYKAWIFQVLGETEASKMARAIRELNELARCGDPIPSAEELKTALNTKQLVDLIAKATGDDREEIAYLEHSEGQ